MDVASIAAEAPRRQGGADADDARRRDDEDGRPRPTMPSRTPRCNRRQRHWSRRQRRCHSRRRRPERRATDDASRLAMAEAHKSGLRRRDPSRADCAAPVEPLRICIKRADVVRRRWLDPQLGPCNAWTVDPISDTSFRCLPRSGRPCSRDRTRAEGTSDDRSAVLSASLRSCSPGLAASSPVTAPALAQARADARHRRQAGDAQGGRDGRLHRALPGLALRPGHLARHRLSREARPSPKVRW